MPNPITSPYGSWKSPFTAELMTAQSISIGQITLDGNSIYWLEGRPLEGGRYALVRNTPQGMQDCLSPAYNVRSRVHEYGGGAMTVMAGIIYYVNFKDQHIYVQHPGGVPVCLTPMDGLRYADLLIDPLRNRLLCVREDHTRAGEVNNTLVSLPLATPGDGIVLASGHDFYASPCLSPDGRQLAWLCWDHPNMPWDGCELWVADVQSDGSLGTGRCVAGDRDVSIFQPEWSPQGVLHFVSDQNGWWNLYSLGDTVEPLFPLEADFGMAQWVFGMRTWGFISEKEILCTYTRQGCWELARLDIAKKTLTPLDLPYTEFNSIHIGEGFAVFIAASAIEPFTLLKYDLFSHQVQILRRSFTLTVPPEFISRPQPVEFPTTNDLAAYGFYYPPTNPDHLPPLGELPPLMVISHGGPTSATNTSLRLGIQYWTSRGFAVLDVNYGGSTGYGRAYRLRLNGNWGLVDVDDCCNGARWLVEHGLADPKRLAIRGGSAGGYTTLAALVFKDVFKAGASHYGICDLEALAADTHKFESRYCDNLVGPYPERRDVYQARSPIHHLQNLATPLILFQGDEDQVVPPAQSQLMFEAVRAKELPVAYLLFQGEQHGFRKAANIQRSFEAELYFYSRVFNFDLAEAIEPVQIENL